MDEDFKTCLKLPLIFFPFFLSLTFSPHTNPRRDASSRPPLNASCSFFSRLVFRRMAALVTRCRRRRRANEETLPLFTRCEATKCFLLQYSEVAAPAAPAHHSELRSEAEDHRAGPLQAFRNLRRFSIFGERKPPGKLSVLLPGSNFSPPLLSRK